MAKYENKDIELIVHIKNGKYYKLTNVITSVTWSGDIKIPSRMLEFDFIQAVNDEKIKNIGIVIDSTVCFYVGGVEIFRGSIVDIDKSSSNNLIKITAFDIGFFLKKDEVNFNFVDTTACDIAKAVFKGKDGQTSLPYGKIAPAGTKITKMFISSTRYDTIMSAYTEHSKKDKAHKKYMIEVDIDKFNVIEKGIVKLKLMFEEGENIESASYKESIENLISRVVVVDEKGNKIKVKENKDLRKLYYYITKVIEQSKNKIVTDEEINSTFKGLERTCSLNGYGDITCKSGYKVQVKDSHTGLVGEFYIDKDKHVWSGGKYSVSLDLNFDNIMDEKNEGKDENKKNGSTGGATDWGHGITEDMLNKVLKGELSEQATTIIKWCNAFKINPLYFAIQAKIECGNNIDSYNARVRHNYGGITADPEFPNMGKYAKYPSKEKGIERMCRLISVKYLNEWNIRAVDKIIAKWAPASDGNDVAGYIRMMKNTYKEITGKTWDNSMLGTGVKSVEEAYNNLNSGSNLSGNAIIEHAINFCIKHLGTPYSQADRNAYKRNPQRPAHFDCSAMVYYAYADAGKLNKNPVNAWTTYTVHDNPSSYGLIYVPLSNAQRGDILWMSGHLGLYLGNGRAVESTSPRSQYCPSKKFTHAYRFKNL